MKFGIGELVWHQDKRDALYRIAEYKPPDSFAYEPRYRLERLCGPERPCWMLIAGWFGEHHLHTATIRDASMLREVRLASLRGTV